MRLSESMRRVLIETRDSPDGYFVPENFRQVRTLDALAARGLISCDMTPRVFKFELTENGRLAVNPPKGGPP